MKPYRSVPIAPFGLATEHPSFISYEQALRVTKWRTQVLFSPIPLGRPDGLGYKFLSSVSPNEIYRGESIESGVAIAESWGGGDKAESEMATLDQWTNLRKEMANVRSMNVNRLATSEIPAGGPTEEETIAKGAKIEEHRSTESEKEDSEVFFVVWEAGRKKFFAINGTKI